MNHSKKVALITGASSGMGKAFAEALLAEGLTVYVAARRVEKMQDLQQQGAIALSMDITDHNQIETAVNTIESNGHSVDVLINNAGFGLYGAMEDISIDDARYQFEVNLFGMARLTQLILPAMRANKAGKIINMSSMGGKVYTPLGSWYHATKHAVEGWSDCLRIELQSFGIDVVVIEPGAIETEFGAVMLEPMIKNSANGPYAKMANAMVNATKTSYEKGAASDPSVITKLVLKAVRSSTPKTRYVAGKYAKPMMFLRKWFGDRVFDKAVLSMVK